MNWNGWNSTVLHQTLRHLFCFLFFGGCLVCDAAAAGGGQHEPSIGELQPYWINFLVYIVLLCLLLRKRLPAFWEARHALIAGEIQRGREDLAAARRALEEAEQRLLLADRHGEELAKKMRTVTSAEVMEIIEGAKRKCAVIQEQTRQNASAEREAALSALREEIIALALSKAGELAKAKLSPDRDREIRAAALEGLPLMLS